MILTTEDKVKEFVFDCLKYIILTFEDGSEVKLSQISDIDIDLNRFEQSYIYITNAVQDAELLNCFSKGKMIIHVHFEPRSINILDCNNIKTFYDIPCNMKINRLRFGTTKSSPGDMYFELEGFAV